MTKQVYEIEICMVGDLGVLRRFRVLAKTFEAAYSAAVQDMENDPEGLQIGKIELKISDLREV